MLGIILSPEDVAGLSPLRTKKLYSLGICHSFVLAFTINLVSVSQLTLGRKGQEFTLFLALKQPLTDSLRNTDYQTSILLSTYLWKNGGKKSPYVVYPHQAHPVTQVWDMGRAKPEVQFCLPCSVRCSIMPGGCPCYQPLYPSSPCHRQLSNGKQGTSGKRVTGFLYPILILGQVWDRITGGW